MSLAARAGVDAALLDEVVLDLFENERLQVAPRLLPVGRLARVGDVPAGRREVAAAHLVPRRLQRGHGGAPDLAERAGDEDLHR